MVKANPRRARIRDKGQITLPREVREALHVAEGDEVEFTVTEHGEVVLRGLTTVPADQAWFWTPEWQAGEREATREIAAGETTTYKNVDELFAALNHSTDEPDDGPR